MPTELKPYTVILMRPAVLQDPALYNDSYIAHVEADSVLKAVYAAQDQVARADANDVENYADYGVEPYDYTVVAAFEGHLKPVHYGN